MSKQQLTKPSLKNIRQTDATPAKKNETEPSIDNKDLLQPKVKKIDSVKKPVKERKRIFLTGVNSLVGHSLFQQMRNDDVMIKTGGKSHEFLGTLVERDADFVPVPSQSIHLLDAKKQPKTFTKGVLTSDIIVIDLLSGTDPSEAETIIKLLR